MRQKFAIGAEIDLLTPAELGQAAAGITKAIVGLRQPPLIERISFPFSSDPAGLVGPAGANGPAVAFRCPMGMRADINRITLDIAGFPTTVVNVTGRLAMRSVDVNGPLVYFWPQPGGNVAPAIESYGGDAPRINGGESLVLVGSALSASQEFILNLQITLFESPARERGEPRL